MRQLWLARRGGLALLAASLLGAFGVAAQTGPRLEADLVRKQSISSEDDAKIASFVAYWAARLSPRADAPDRVRQIHEAVRTLGSNVYNNPNVSPVFRAHYGRALVPALQPLVTGADDPAAIRSMYLLSRVGTDGALALILQQITHDNPIRRNAAAAAAKGAIRDMPRTRPSLIDPATVNTLLRTTARQAAVEADPAALQRQFELLDQIHTTSLALTQDLPSLTADAQARRLEVLGECAARMRPNLVEVDALDMFMRNLRSTFLATPAAQRRDGPMLALHLTQILRTAQTELQNLHPDRARADGGLHASYSRLIADAENFLKLIDQTIRADANPPTPNTRLKDHWDQRNTTQFEQDLRKWDAILQVAPYRR